MRPDLEAQKRRLAGKKGGKGSPKPYGKAGRTAAALRARTELR